jgi:hypothetical protein
VFFRAGMSLFGSITLTFHMEAKLSHGKTSMLSRFSLIMHWLIKLYSYVVIIVCLFENVSRQPVSLSIKEIIVVWCDSFATSCSKIVITNSQTNKTHSIEFRNVLYAVVSNFSRCFLEISCSCCF